MEGSPEIEGVPVGVIEMEGTKGADGAIVTDGALVHLELFDDPFAPDLEVVGPAVIVGLNDMDGAPEGDKDIVGLIEMDGEPEGDCDVVGADVLDDFFDIVVGSAETDGSCEIDGLPDGAIEKDGEEDTDGDPEG